jgi:hypothetical protein
LVISDYKHKKKTTRFSHAQLIHYSTIRPRIFQINTIDYYIIKNQLQGSIF